MWQAMKWKIKKTYDQNKMKEVSKTQAMEEITSNKSDIDPMQSSRDKISIVTLVVASCLVFAILKSKVAQLLGWLEFKDENITSDKCHFWVSFDLTLVITVLTV